MYQIAYLGRWETLPETAAAIYEHDISRLEAMLQGGLDLNVPIQLSEYIKLMPLEIAVFQNDVPMIHFLLEHGADPDLAVEQPLLCLLYTSYHVRRTWYNVWKQTLYHSASGFCVHRRNPGAQISRRGTMSEGHGIMSGNRHYTIAHLVFAFTAKIQALKSPGGVPCPKDMV